MVGYATLISIVVLYAKRERSRAFTENFHIAIEKSPSTKQQQLFVRVKFLFCAKSYLMRRLVLQWGDRRLHKHPPGFTWGRDLRPHLRYSAALRGKTGPHLGIPLSRGTESTH